MKNYRKKLDDFLETKDAKMQEFLEILNLNEFTFSQDEINQVEKIYKENEDLYEYAYIYIGEAYIHLIGGKWRLNTTKKDPAYGRMCIVDWAKGAIRIDPMYILNELEKTQDYNTIYNDIESTKKIL